MEDVTIQNSVDANHHGEVVKTNFIREVFSDDGAPSSSRILTFILSLGALAIVGGIIWHVCHLKDASILGLWLTSIPAIIMSLIGLSAAPYAINRSTNSISDVLSALRK